MRKVAVAALAAVGLVGVVSPAGAATTAGPCSVVWSVQDKYNIYLNMHQAQVEYVWGEVCRHTG